MIVYNALKAHQESRGCSAIPPEAEGVHPEPREESDWAQHPRKRYPQTCWVAYCWEPSSPRPTGLLVQCYAPEPLTHWHSPHLPQWFYGSLCRLTRWIGSSVPFYSTYSAPFSHWQLPYWHVPRNNGSWKHFISSKSNARPLTVGIQGLQHARWKCPVRHDEEQSSNNAGAPS